MAKKKTPKNLKQLHEKNAATRFGGNRANPQRQDIPGAPAPWEVRKAYGVLCNAKFAKADKAHATAALKKANGGKDAVLTGAQHVAAAVMAKAMKGDLAAAEIVTNANEGKLVDNININSSGSIEHREQPMEDGPRKEAAVAALLRFAAKYQNTSQEK